MFVLQMQQRQLDFSMKYFNVSFVLKDILSIQFLIYYVNTQSICFRY